MHTGRVGLKTKAEQTMLCAPHCNSSSQPATAHAVSVSTTKPGARLPASSGTVAGTTRAVPLGGLNSPPGCSEGGSAAPLYFECSYRRSSGTASSTDCWTSATQTCAPRTNQWCEANYHLPRTAHRLTCKRRASLSRTAASSFGGGCACVNTACAASKCCASAWAVASVERRAASDASFAARSCFCWGSPNRPPPASPGSGATFTSALPTVLVDSATDRVCD